MSKGAVSARSKANQLKELAKQGRDFLASGDKFAAAAEFTKMLAINSRHAEALYSLGAIAFQDADYQNAVAWLTVALAQRISKKNVARALDYLGTSLAFIGRHNEAIAYFKRLLNLNPRDAQGLRNLGVAYFTVGMYAEAAACFKKILSIDPRNADAHSDLASALYQLHLVDEALAGYKRAISIQPDHAVSHKNLGMLFNAIGKFEEAVTSYDQALAKNPESTGIHFNHVLCRKITHEDASHIARLEELAQRQNVAAEIRSDALFALGKCHDDLGLYDKAFEYYSRGNRLEYTKCRMNRRQTEDMVSATIRMYSKEFFAAREPLPVSDDTPIFIVGMPRSGTTLIDQIISSHSEVSSAGESVFWKDQPEANLVGGIEAIEPAAFRTLAQKYLSHLRRYAPDSRHVVDKMPQNFMHLGLIHLCLPSARIIHCRRNPLDTGLSVYFVKFSAPHPYAYDLDDIAFYYEQYERLMKHWAEVLPARILDVQYEDLIADQAAVTRRMLEFCNLEWEEDCLNFQHNERPVFTASSWQVRQALYVSSVDRWKNYRRHIGPLMRLVDTPHPVMSAAHSFSETAPGQESAA